MRIVFWNLNKKDLIEQVCNVVISNSIDVVVLNENTVPEEQVLRELRKVDSNFVVPTSVNHRFQCFARSASHNMEELHDGSRTSFRLLHMGDRSLLIGLVHGVDIRNYDAETRQSFAEELGEEIRFVKNLKRNNKIILIGDFNMNPFDRGMNLARGLNAMSTKSCVSSKERGYGHKKYDFYYNPMWSLLGDNTKGPAGTVYDTSNQGLYGWSMLDQVIINHSIVDLFESVEILSKAGSDKLTTVNGRPNKNLYSDHLPIQLTLTMEI